VSDSPAIDIRSLVVTRRRRRILDIDELRVPRGRCAVILGPNGAGKTTLLHCCTGLVRPRRGSVTVLGRDVGSAGSLSIARLRRRVALVGQVLAGRSELPLTVREVVQIGRTGWAGLFRPLGRNDRDLAEQWIERLGLGELADQAYSQLSGGEQRKVLIAKAMTQQPEVLLLDEPTANLDLYWREQIVRTLSELRSEPSLTLVLVCHELEVIPPGTDAVAVIEDGRVRHLGTVDEVLTPAIVSELYGPDIAVERRGDRVTAVPRGRLR
jgi:ABC-type cobalamin/Fe3+-siderophores transport system ATPase subunit